MHEITVEAVLGAQLGDVVGQVLLRDSEGRALGFFSPIPDRPLAENLQLEPPLSIAETQELRKIQTGKPLNEILDRLGVS